ncbi:lipopolysaccharide transport periplasmic protein LptA, partial [Clostridioides difficile]|nr:lipopolysaccharide transport periplasmic protein LptA [Clostridioides difficile]
LKQVTVATGNVVITKGTIIIKGDRVEVRQDPEGYQYATSVGSGKKHATFRQKREGRDEYIDGDAERIDYDGKQDLTTLTTFTAGVLGLFLIPGPAVLLVLSRPVQGGRKSGILTGLGVASGDCVHTLFAAVGLSALLRTSA